MNVVERACAPEQCAAYTGVILLNDKSVGEWRLLLSSHSPRNAYPDKSSESRVCVCWVSCPFISFFFSGPPSTDVLHQLLLLIQLLPTTNIVYHYTTRILKRTRSVWSTFRSRTALDLLIIPFVIYKRKYYTYSTHNTYTAMPLVVY